MTVPAHNRAMSRLLGGTGRCRRSRWHSPLCLTSQSPTRASNLRL